MKKNLYQIHMQLYHEFFVVLPGRIFGDSLGWYHGGWNPGTSRMRHPSDVKVGLDSPQ